MRPLGHTQQSQVAETKDMGLRSNWRQLGVGVKKCFWVFFRKKSILFVFVFLYPLRLVACGDLVFKPPKFAFFLDLFPKKIYAIGTCRGGRKNPAELPGASKGLCV
jgi:hypothetical protein